VPESVSEVSKESGTAGRQKSPCHRRATTTKTPTRKHPSNDYTPETIHARRAHGKDAKDRESEGARQRRPNPAYEAPADAEGQGHILTRAGLLIALDEAYARRDEVKRQIRLLRTGRYTCRPRTHEEEKETAPRNK
jgi:hypothetical protein